MHVVAYSCYLSGEIHTLTACFAFSRPPSEGWPGRTINCPSLVNSVRLIAEGTDPGICVREALTLFSSLVSFPSLLLYPSFPLYPLPLSFPSPLPSSPTLPLLSLPLEVGPLNTAKGSGERCKLPSGVWGRAPAEMEFCAFSLKIWHAVVTIYFPRNQLTKFRAF